MNFDALKKNIDSFTGGIFLLEGEDAYFRERSLLIIKNKFVQMPELNYTVFDGDNLDVADLISAVKSYPFMSERRLVVVREFYPKKSSGIDELLINPVNETVLVFSNSKSCDYIKKTKGVVFVDCSKEEPESLAKRITLLLAQSKLVISPECAKTFAEYCRFDMTQISGEIEKLRCLMPNGGLINQTVLDENVTKSTEYKIFMLTDAVGKKDADRAFEILNEMLSCGEPFQRLLFSLYNYFNKLLTVALANDDDLSLASLLGISDYVLKITKRQAKLFKKSALKKAVDTLSEIDFKTKSGEAELKEAFYYGLLKILAE